MVRQGGEEGKRREAKLGIYDSYCVWGRGEEKMVREEGRRG